MLFEVHPLFLRVKRGAGRVFHIHGRCYGRVPGEGLHLLLERHVDGDVDGTPI